MKNKVTLAGIIAGCLLLTSCIAVQDAGSYWDQAKPDLDLVGYWTVSDPSKDCVQLFVDSHNNINVSEKDHKSMEMKPSNTPMRSLIVGNHRFFLMKSSHEDSAHPISALLIKYEVTENELRAYQPNRLKREEFTARYSSSNISVSQGKDMAKGFYTVEIRVLDKETLSILKEVADKPDYWKLETHYRRIANCEPLHDKH